MDETHIVLLSKKYGRYNDELLCMILLLTMVLLHFGKENTACSCVKHCTQLCITNEARSPQMTFGPMYTTRSGYGQVCYPQTVS